ncbi:MAG: hypothetical protein ACKOCN_11285 [Planctomycetaceae bacterium]
MNRIHFAPFFDRRATCLVLADQRRGCRQRPIRLVARGATVLAMLSLILFRGNAGAAEQDRLFTIGEGAYSLRSPEGWNRVEPKFAMIEAEYSAPPAKEGQPAGRMTVMGAGGKIEDNLERWFGQFSQPDGSATKSKATTKKMKVAGCDVTLVDVPGTFRDAPMGPFAGGKTVERPDYRMLAAIVETPDRGNYFIKFYGPADCVSRDADGFRAMIEGLVAAKAAAAK